MNFIALDFETANTLRTSVCSVGLVFVEDGQICDKLSFFVRPEPYYFRPDFTDLHGIGYPQTDAAPSFPQLWKQIKPLLNKKKVIAHNAAFDFFVLHDTLRAHGLSFPDMEIHCSLRIARRCLHLQQYKLNVLAAHYNIPLQHHDALSDASACASIAMKLAALNETDDLTVLTRIAGMEPGRFIARNKQFVPITTCLPTTRKMAKMHAKDI
jgi:DNA polymerase-3 subunit epsilon